MRNKYLITLFLLFAMNLYGCYEDKGNYNYSQIDDLKVTLAPAYSVSKGDLITVTPEIILADGSTCNLDNYNFEWSVNGETREDWSKSVFSWETDKNVEFGNLILEVKDKHSKISFFASASISVNGTYNMDEGWVILSEKNGESVLSIYKITDYDYDDQWEHITINESVIQQDVYKHENGQAAGVGPTKLIEHYRLANNYVGPFLLLQDSGPIEINGETMGHEFELAQTFANGILPAGEKIVDASFKVYTDVLVGETGKLYSRIKSDASLFNSGRYLQTPLKLNGEVLEGCRVIQSPKLAWGQSIHLIQDTKKNRFLIIGDYGSSVSEVKHYPEEAPENFIPLNDLSSCKILKIDYVKNGFYNEGGHRMILKKDNIYYYQKFTVNASGESGYYGIEEINGLTEDPTCIYFSQNSEYVMIAIRNKLYYYDTMNPERGIELYLDFDSDIFEMAESWNCCMLTLKNNKFFMIDFIGAKSLSTEKRILYSSPANLDLGEIKAIIKKKQTM